MLMYAYNLTLYREVNNSHDAGLIQYDLQAISNLDKS